MTDYDRIWSKIDWQTGKADGCWTWTASRSKDGYGRVYWKGRNRQATHVVWELLMGPVPPDKQVLHHCDNPPCVRIDHLYLGQPRENARDRERRGRSNHPPVIGRPFDKGHRPLNLKVTPKMAGAIRRDYFISHVKQADLAAKYGVSQQTISNVIRRVGEDAA